MGEDTLNEVANLGFEGFPKIGRLKRTCIVTEKIDGTNAAILIAPRAQVDSAVRDSMGFGLFHSKDHPTQTHPFFAEVGEYALAAQSRNRMIWPGQDNQGFAAWVLANAEELIGLGVGRHFGEWWGRGIQRGYGLDEKRFSLFNAQRWNSDNPPPRCCSVVPVLYHGVFCTAGIEQAINRIQNNSVAAAGFPNPEGIVVYHTATKTLFKWTFENDHGKGPDAQEKA
jgi:hypothetical protein